MAKAGESKGRKRGDRVQPVACMVTYTWTNQPQREAMYTSKFTSPKTPRPVT